jgi:hemoglobin
VKAFHGTYGKAGFKYLVTTWSIEYSSGLAVYPGRSMAEAHDKLEYSGLELDVVRTEIKTSLYQLGVPEPDL